jgi:Nitrile hydratase beta subunit
MFQGRRFVSEKLMTRVLDATDIWGLEKSEPNTTIYADLFEAYLQPSI